MWAVVIPQQAVPRVRARISRTAALAPVQLLDGTWILPARCLVEIAEARPAIAGALAALPRRRLVAADFPPEAEVTAGSLRDAAAADALRFKALDGGPVEVLNARRRV